MGYSSILGTLLYILIVYDVGFSCACGARG